MRQSLRAVPRLRSRNRGAIGTPGPRPRNWCRGQCVAALVVLVAAAPTHAQVPGAAKTYYAKQPSIVIPFEQTPGLAQVKQLNLFYSTDQGQSWQWHDSAPPANGKFKAFLAPSDGQYWFAVQTIDWQNQTTPPALGQLTALVKIIVDRRPPSIQLRQAIASVAGRVGVEWDVRDEHLDIPGRGRFALDYRIEGVTDWIREGDAKPGASGRQEWEGLTAGQRMTVRLRVADAAGNEANETTMITLDGRPPAAPGGGGGGGTPEARDNGVHYVKDRTISIPYTIPKLGPSGLSAFDLWFTKNGGQSWEKATTNNSAPGALPTNPGETNVPQQGSMRFEADGEGQFGFLIVARNGVGLGDPDPRPGDRPRIRVEVDTTPPTVQVRAQPGRGMAVRDVVLSWQADDKNLPDRPVLLQYAEAKPGGPPAETDWKPIPVLPDAQPKAGGYTWTIGREGPFKFWVRAVARDKAGNQGIDQPKLDDRTAIIVDLEVPRVELGDPFGGTKRE
jgi:hypothetical protein